MIMRFSQLLLKRLQKTKVLFSKRFLLYTNTGLGVITAVSGDLIQQNYQRVMNDETRKWDKQRSLKMAAAGFGIGLCSHYWYIILEKNLPGRSLKSLVKKVTLDMFVFSPFCISVFLVIIGLMEQQGLNLLKEEFQGTGVFMFLTSVLVWTPAQTVNYYFVPMKYRVLFDNSVSLIVDNFYSYLRFEQDRSGEKKLRSLELMKFKSTK